MVINDNHQDELEEFESEIYQIRNEFTDDRKLLEEQIEHIKLIEQKINTLIFDLESAVQHFQNLIENEKDTNKKKNYHTAIAYNIERLTKLYGVLREYQDTKYKYLATITDMSYKKNRLIHVEMSKIKDTSNPDSYTLFNKLIQAMNNNTPAFDEVNEINNDDDYKV